MDQTSGVSLVSLYATREEGTTPATETDESDGVAEARAKIEETRAHLTDTVDAIKDKLSPAHIVEEVKEAALGKAGDMVSGAVETVKTTASNVAESAKDLYHAAADKVTDIGHAVSDKVASIGGGKQDQTTAYGYMNGVGTGRSPGATIMDTIKMNPLPAAMIGFGIGWLALSLRKQESVEKIVGATPAGTTYDVYDQAPYAPSSDYMNGASTSTTPGLADRASSLVHGVSDKVSDAAHTVGQKASDVAHSVGQKASDVASSVGQKASDLSGRASDWAGGVRDSASQWKDKAGDTVNNFAVQTKAQAGAASDSVVTFINEQPLAAAGIAFIIGAAVAASLPTTQKENELLGPPRDRLVDQGKDAAQDVAQKVQAVATTAFGQAKDSLSQTVDQAKQQIQQTVQQTHDTVVSEAHNQGLVGAAA